ncbi:GerAB/ArcD/ProY family transporter [Dendrosporobacter sp. 1207_IL3150]|uniref:GerAB/ArcD/ProY family transporter n=1 Tax=Dendrosporobacter sp. 1207_IL3150 TaxID=3084054 RepID=UPI002FDACCE2
MANLEVKSQMSPWQLGIMIAAIGIGTEVMAGGRTSIENAGENAWQAFLLGGLIYCGITLVMARLGEYFPNQDLLDYMPKLWGKLIGSLIIAVYVSLFLGYFTLATANFSRLIGSFMFDRTPHEVIALTMVMVCVYCALQDLGTNLRVIQLVSLITIPLFMLVFFTGFLSFQSENLMPLLPKDIMKFLKAVPDTWGAYAGYEIVLMLLPLVNRGRTSLSKPIIAGFAIMAFVFSTFSLITVGVLTAENAKTISYPAIEVVRFVELPGTFLERLEIYLLSAWIPNIFTTLVIYLYIAANVLRRLSKHEDHRPWVLLLAPWMLFASTILIELTIPFKAMGKAIQTLGLAFSFIIIPASLFLAWRKKRKV